MPKIVDHDRYRREMLTRAAGAFARKGFSALSLKDLAEGLGVSPGSFYHYFRNKEDLFFQMTTQLARELVDHLTRDLDPAQPLAARLTEMLFRLEQREEDFQNLYFILQDFMRVIGVQEFRSSEEFGALFRQLHESMRLALGVTERQTDFIFTYVSGIIHNRTLFPGAAAVSSHQRMLCALLDTEAFAKLDRTVAAADKPPRRTARRA